MVTPLLATNCQFVKNIVNMRKKVKEIISKYAGFIAFIFILIGFIFIIVFSISAFLNDWVFIKNASLFAQYGEFIGGFIGTIFSLAGFLLIYKTLITQQETLKQQDSVSRQDRFEITFFNLLKNQNDITNNIKAYFFSLKGFSAEVTYSVIGRDFFIYSKNELMYIWKALTSKTYLGYYNQDIALFAQENINELYNLDTPDSWNPGEIEERETEILFEIKLRKINKRYGITQKNWEYSTHLEIKDQIGFAYNFYFQKYHYVAGHYFRHLYHILDFAEMSKKQQYSMTKDLNMKIEIQKSFKKYISFTQAQMSSFELMLLYYNSFLFPKMLSLIRRNDFLENLAVEDLIDKTHNCIEGIILKSREDLF